MINHPKERFGCTICHRGQGLATTLEDAHGHVPHWRDPVVSRQQIDEACPKCHTERSLPGVARYNAAMDLFYAKACLSCHKLRGQGGVVGPDISQAGELHDAEWHFRHFKDPKSVVETSEMPNLNLSDDEAQALTFLMMSLTGEPIPTELLSNPKLTPLETDWADKSDPLAAKGHVGSRICIGCHQGLHPAAVDGWRNSKMSSTYERIRNEPIKDNCLPCHTTGFNPATGHYSEEGVGCEACHGPGSDAVKLALVGKTQEHKDAIRLNVDSTLVCARCHNPHISVGLHADYYRRQPPRFSQAAQRQPIDRDEPPRTSATNENRPSARSTAPSD
ncbi:MAG: cbb3-type cytochrome c oxidase subunit II [Phycisphaerae bacterium]